MFERFTEHGRKLVLLTLAAIAFAVLVEITVRLQDNPTPKDERYRPVHRRHKRPATGAHVASLAGFKRFIRRRGPMIARFLRRWGPVVATSILPIMVAALQIVAETLNLLQEFI
jgi:hypothetical protein